jgi:hypothetical protein
MPATMPAIKAGRREPRMSESERQRWERLRRALLNVVAQQHDADPDAQYTLDIRIVPKDRAQKIASY